MTQFVTLLMFCSFSFAPLQAISSPTADRVWTAAELEDRFGALNSPVLVEGDTLTFIAKSNGRALRVVGTFNQDLERIGETDFHMLVKNIPNLDRAVVRYRIEKKDNAGLILGKIKSDFSVWRGPLAPPELPIRSDLKGSILQQEVFSAALNEKRPVQVYLPPQHDKAQSYPIFYMTDGNSIQGYASILEGLITDGKISPAIIVGVPHGGYTGDPNEKYDAAKDLRQIEYLARFGEFIEGADTTRFEKHKKFFVEEVSLWAETNYGASADAAYRFYLGSSNGGSFGVTLGLEYPQHFSKLITYAIGWQFSLKKPDWDKQHYPQFYIGTGSLDDFLKTGQSWAKMLETGGYKHHYTEWVTGHSALFWREDFHNAAQWALGQSPAR